MIGWGQDGLTYEADQRHAEILIKGLKMEDCKAASTPGAREDVGHASIVRINASGEVENESSGDSAGAPLSSADATKYRALAARANYLAQDRVDIQFAVKEIARRMA